MGRPSKYKKEYCEKLVEHMKLGLSFETFAAILDISKQTLYNWKDANPDFMDAVSRGFLHGQLFWEKLGIDHIITETTIGVGSKSLNSNVWKFNMQNRYNWTDKREVTKDVKDMAEDEFNALAAKVVERIKNDGFKEK